MTPLETFAGQDLLKVLADNQQEDSTHRKFLQAKVSAARAAQQAVQHARKAEETKPSANASVTEAAPEDQAGEAGQKDNEQDTAESTDDAKDDKSEHDKDENENDEKEATHEGITCDCCKVRNLNVPTQTADKPNTLDW